MKRAILMYPDPMLKQVSVAVGSDFGEDPETTRLEAFRVGMDLVDTLCSTQNGVGLAAIQIGEPVRMIVVRPDRAKDPIVLVNPTVVVPDGTPRALLTEGCLSFPGLYEKVMRYTSVVVNAFDVQGRAMEIDTRRERPIAGAPNAYDPEDLRFFAHILQHEIDHLDGVLFPERLTFTPRQRAKYLRRFVESRP